MGFTRRGSVRTPVLEIAYEEAGPADGPVAVLSHGFPYDVRAYDEVADVLAASGMRVIAPYLRGYGPTRFTDAATMRSGEQAALAQDLLDLLDALGIDRAVVGGYDWGGRASCIVAALHPSRVSGLVTVGGYNIFDPALRAGADTSRVGAHVLVQVLLPLGGGRRGLERYRHELCELLWTTWSPEWADAATAYAASAPSLDNPDFVDVVIHSYRHRSGARRGRPALRRDRGGPRRPAVDRGADRRARERRRRARRSERRGGPRSVHRTVHVPRARRDRPQPAAGGAARVRRGGAEPALSGSPGSLLVDAVRRLVHDQHRLRALGGAAVDEERDHGAQGGADRGAQQQQEAEDLPPVEPELQLGIRRLTREREREDERDDRTDEGAERDEPPVAGCAAHGDDVVGDVGLDGLVDLDALDAPARLVAATPSRGSTRSRSSPTAAERSGSCGWGVFWGSLTPPLSRTRMGPLRAQGTCSTGRCARRSARWPEACTRPAARASSHVSPPVARASHVAASVSTTFGGVPRVCLGPSTHCTAAYGGTRTSTVPPAPARRGAAACSAPRARGSCDRRMPRAKAVGPALDARRDAPDRGDRGRTQLVVDPCARHASILPHGTVTPGRAVVHGERRAVESGNGQHREVPGEIGAISRRAHEATVAGVGPSQVARGELPSQVAASVSMRSGCRSPVWNGSSMHRTAP